MSREVSSDTKYLFTVLMPMIGRQHTDKKQPGIETGGSSRRKCLDRAYCPTKTRSRLEEPAPSLVTPEEGEMGLEGTGETEGSKKPEGLLGKRLVTPLGVTSSTIRRIVPSTLNTPTRARGRLGFLGLLTRFLYFFKQSDPTLFGMNRQKHITRMEPVWFPVDRLSL